ncbi:MAG: DUF6515 family protein [Candidatus Cryptobacteroides sp.]
MKRFRTIAAMMLTVSALAMVCSESDAQTRRSEATTTSRQGTASRQGTSVRQGTTTRQTTSPQQGTATRQGTTVQRPTNSTRPVSTTSSRPTVTGSQPSTTIKTRPTVTETRPSGNSGTRQTTTRPSTTNGTRLTTTAGTHQVTSGTRPTTTRPTNRVDANRPMEVNRPGNNVEPGRHQEPGRHAEPGRHQGPGGHAEPGRHPGPVMVGHHPDEHRVHPRDREFMHYNAPSYFWAHDHHCYGHRVRVLPSHALRHHWCGHVYYCYNDIWYRPYGGYYVVCRPPFGTVLAAQVIADMAWASVRISYYNTVARTYDAINANNQLIAEQNAVIEQNNKIIAQNNALIAAQNQAIAQGQKYAAESYAKANELGLIQSYADADETYYYQDGVFYSMGSDGQYMVIIPPAGALVETLPEDYDMVTLKGDEYYQVDDTIYTVTIKEGKPYFEVLGQLYS